MASRVRRARALIVAVGLSTLLAGLAVATAFAGGGTGPWPK